MAPDLPAPKAADSPAPDASDSPPTPEAVNPPVLDVTDLSVPELTDLHAPEIAECETQITLTKRAEEPPGDRAEMSQLAGDVTESTDPPKKSEPTIVDVPSDHLEWGLGSPVWHKIEEIVSQIPSDQEVRNLVVDWQSVLSDPRLPHFCFPSDTFSPPSRFVAVPVSEPINNLWFIGDVHGDILGLETALAYIATQDVDPAICFLGDLFDRGYRHGAVLFRFMQLFNQKSGKVAIVVGNHDDGLFYDTTSEKFSSTVRPSEASDWLNELPLDSPWRELAKSAIDFFKRAPRALLLPDGMLVAHGGVPHIDLQGTLTSKDNLENPDVLEDFVWTRLHETAKKRVPNRTTRGCSLGIADFDRFCSTLQNLLGRPVRGIIRGHDHLETRFDYFEHYREHTVLTINTMCHRLNSEMPGPFQTPLIVAKYTSGEMLTIHRMWVPDRILNAIYTESLDTIGSEGGANESR